MDVKEQLKELYRQVSDLEATRKKTPLVFSDLAAKEWELRLQIENLEAVLYTTPHNTP